MPVGDLVDFAESTVSEGEDRVRSFGSDLESGADTLTDAGGTVTGASVPTSTGDLRSGGSTVQSGLDRSIGGVTGFTLDNPLLSLQDDVVGNLMGGANVAGQLAGGTSPGDVEFDRDGTRADVAEAFRDLGSDVESGISDTVVRGPLDNPVTSAVGTLGDALIRPPAETAFGTVTGTDIETGETGFRPSAFEAAELGLVGLGAAAGRTGAAVARQSDSVADAGGLLIRLRGGRGSGTPQADFATDAQRVQAERVDASEVSGFGSPRIGGRDEPADVFNVGRSASPTTSGPSALPAGARGADAGTDATRTAGAARVGDATTDVGQAGRVGDAATDAGQAARTGDAVTDAGQAGRVGDAATDAGQAARGADAAGDTGGMLPRIRGTLSGSRGLGDRASRGLFGTRLRTAGTLTGGAIAGGAIADQFDLLPSLPDVPDLEPDQVPEEFVTEDGFKFQFEGPLPATEEFPNGARVFGVTDVDTGITEGYWVVLGVLDGDVYLLDDTGDLRTATIDPEPITATGAGIPQFEEA